MGQADIDRLSPTAEDGCRPSGLFGRDDGDVCPADVEGKGGTTGQPGVGAGCPSSQDSWIAVRNAGGGRVPRSNGPVAGDLCTTSDLTGGSYLNALSTIDYSELPRVAVGGVLHATLVLDTYPCPRMHTTTCA